MPIVFVHGVNNRKGSAYEDNEAGRNGFIQEIVAPALGLPSGGASIHSPYWGDEGVKFAWNMAVLPDSSDKHEMFGDDLVEALADRQAGELVLALELKDGVVASARRDFAGAVEALYGAMLAGASSQKEGQTIAASYVRARKYVADNPRPPWLDDDDLLDQNFADTLNAELDAVGGDEEESFGAGGFLGQLQEGVRRLTNVIPDASSGLLVKLGRKKLNATAGLFLGDALVYLKNRGTSATPGPIVKIVLDELRAAVTEAPGEKLVVIAHSFGCEIIYDILTHFASDLVVDVLVTVGSQVGLFEEMKLFEISDPAVPHPGADKVEVPHNLKRWLNVYDDNDVLAYKAEAVFDRVTDFHYDTGFSSLDAHGGYFLQPSFYARLASRLVA